MDRVLDEARTGPRYLAMPEIASVVVGAIRYRDQKQYQLHSYVVMPNHVHLLITPHRDLSKILQSLKLFTATECNKILDRTGEPFWQSESYDRLVRDDTEFQRIKQYIEMNPVKAGFAASAEAFSWSSARPIGNRPQVGNVGNLPYSVDWA